MFPKVRRRNKIRSFDSQSKLWGYWESGNNSCGDIGVGLSLDLPLG